VHRERTFRSRRPHPSGAIAGVDLTDFLREWPHEPGGENVRLVRAADARIVIQLRLDLGVLQMELEGRPDGLRVEGSATWLEHYDPRTTAEPEGDTAHAPAAEAPAPTEDERHAAPRLDETACRRLREEAIQFHHRYVSLFALQDHERVVRDTRHNLRIIELVVGHGESPPDAAILLQLWPHVRMMLVRAEAARHEAEGRSKIAIAVVEEGIRALEEFYRRERTLDEEATTSSPEDGRTGPAFDPEEEPTEVRILRALRDTLVPKLPMSERSELRERLAAALRAENYELAAILRDELRLLRE